MSELVVSLSGELIEHGHRLTQRVYYEDTDFSGLVYHARYLHFLERGRTDYLRCLGCEQSALLTADEEGLVFVVHRMEIDFKTPARMDDVLTITTVTEKAGGAKWCSIRKSGAAKHCWSPPRSSSPSSMPMAGQGVFRRRWRKNS